MEKFKHNKTLFAAVLLLLLATSAYAVSPKVVKTVPQNGDENIRPGLRRIKILFDQDMNHQGHSVCGGGPTFPEIVGKPKWTDKRTFMMSAKLKPSTEYELYVNSPSHKNFKNLQGEPAVVYHLKFKTAPVKEKAPGAGKSPALLLQKARYAEETEGDLDKAIELYQQAIERADQVQRIAAQATYQLAMCYLKKGEKKKAIEYLGLVSNYPTQKAIVEKAKQQLKELKPEKVDSVFEQMSYQTLMFIADKYGKLAAEAGAKSLFCNAHIYYVDSDLAVYSGGLGYHYNWTAHSLTGKVRLGGTSYPNQTLYDTNGQKLNTEIVEDEKTKGFYHIYWTPEEPLKPQEALYYGWSKNDKRKLSPLPGSGKGILTMQNQYGPKVLETFFLVLPPELAIAQDAAPTDSHDFGDYKVFWWTKTVQQGENHLERVQLKKNSSAQYAARLKNKVTVSVAKSPDGNRLTVQYAAIEICKTADVPYQWDKSQKLAGEKIRRYIEPLNFENTAANEALNSILEQLGLKYVVDADGVYLIDTKEWVQGLVEDFFKHNYRDITSRKTIEWGNPVTDATGNVSISYKYEMIIWNKDKYLANELFTFDKNGKYLSARKVEGFPKPLGKIVFLPDADDVIQQGKVAVVLDLKTGKMLPGNKDKQYFNKLNKGDVAYADDEGLDLLICFRGAKITRKTANGKYSDTPDQSHTDNTIHIYIIKKTPAEWTITTKEGDIYDLKVLSLDNDQAKIKYRKIPAGGKVWTFTPDLSTPEATIKSFVKAVYDGNLEAAKACVSKDGADYDEFKEMLATESNHPFQAMIKAMDASIPVEITRKDITEDRCKIKWHFTLGRVYYIGDTKIKKGTHQEFSSYLELIGDKWLIRDI